jgi:hypothetical protein
LPSIGNIVSSIFIMSAKKKTTPKSTSKVKTKLAAKRKLAVPPGTTSAGASSNPIAPWAMSVSPLTRPEANLALALATAQEPLLVCLQDPFDGIGTSWSKIVDSDIPASDNNPLHQWRLRSVMELNPPRVFESWATRGSFTLDLTVRGSVTESAGQWGGNVDTFTSTGTCRVIVMRDADNKVRMSLVAGVRHADEKRLPSPDANRFLNADVGFEANGSSGITAGAVAVISTKNWSRLIAGSAVVTKGLAFDGKWRSNLEEGDGDSTAQGTWAFAVLTRADYSALCRNNGWLERVD